MNKADLLRVTRKAKSSHIRWRAYAQALVAGLDVPVDNAPVSHLSCGFGKWYYGEGARHLGHLDVYRNIETPHEILHDIYGCIHALIDDGKTEAATPMLEQLIGVSRTLLDAIQLLDREVMAMPDRHFPDHAAIHAGHMAEIPAGSSGFRALQAKAR
ncbi:MAG: hypothetical protein FD157_530 [Rhodocyclaceae bacterium]|nr:MAG: hypothetical protein FD157_530 [Rhodocyclaceae bacterium]TND03025.1 MAG: hypothetical protein FD118_1601 [Rhodocyclaceae bacterium]